MTLRETTLLLILDACRADYLTPDKTPFLASLATESLTGAFESPPGFAQRTTMFTGTYPDTSGNLSAFGYGPENSPFAWMRALGPLARLYVPRKVMFPARLAVKHLSRAITGKYHTDPAWIPGPFLPYFEVVEDSKPIFDPGALPRTSVFDLLRAAGKSFRYLAHPVSGDDEEIFRLLLDTFGAREPHALVVAQWSALDEKGHHKGPVLPDGWAPALGQRPGEVATMRDALAEIDRKARLVYEKMREGYDDFHFLVLGDHGMAPVRRRVNVLALLRKLPLRAGKDYVVFLDSTFAKFWFHNERARAEIEALLAVADFGRVLGDEEKARLRIRFPHRRYGDLLFAADPGVLFWPDYFHVVEHDIKGMHGYVDKREETYGALLLRSSRAKPGAGKVRPLVDVFPTLCDLAGVPTPDSNEGRSLV